MASKIIIAIDGYAGCGKSTLAKSLAESIQYLYLDTGAMYRAVSYFYLQKKISYDDENAVLSALPTIDIDFRKIDGTVRTMLNDVDVEEKIRSMEVNNVVTKYAAIKEVRQALVRQQQEIGKQKGIVIDGRDIGTVVFPDAELKLFITANIEIRAARRLQEFQAKDPHITMAEVIANLQLRDRDETTRIESPLVKAPEAIEIDTSDMDKEQALHAALELYYAKMAS